MLTPQSVLSMFSLGLTALGAGVVSSQDYPNRPIRIVTAGAGGANDLVARIIAQGLTGPLGQQVIVENRGGASGIIATLVVVKAPPDGYTLLSFSSPVWLLPFLQDNVPYDPVRDLSPVTLTTRLPNILVVHPSLPAKSVKELIALAKANPGELDYGSSSTGAPIHLAAELFKAMAGVNIVRIPYRAAAQAVNDLVGGRVHLAFPSVIAAAPHVKSGRLRALAVTSAQPSTLFPSLPTVAAAGLPGYEAVTFFGVFAPAGAPATIINRLNQEIVRALNGAEVKERFFNVGVEVTASSPEEFAAAIKSDMARMGKVIKDAGIRAD